MSPDFQLTPDGRLRHLLSLDGLPAPLLRQLLDPFVDDMQRCGRIGKDQQA